MKEVNDPPLLPYVLGLSLEELGLILQVHVSESHGEKCLDSVLLLWITCSD